MQPIGRIICGAQWGWQAIQRGWRYHKLETMNIPSGLGSSAWLLYGLIRSYKPQVAVEIGSAQGNSTCHIGMALRENGMGKLYAIDPHMPTDWNDEGAVDSYDTLKRNLQRLHLRKSVRIVRKTSEEAARDWKAPIDVLFIDGDHSYEGVKRDWDLFSPFVSEFGVVVFHDTLWLRKPDERFARADMGVPKFVEELREEGYPVVTVDRNFGVSCVQPTRHGATLLSLA